MLRSHPASLGCYVPILCLDDSYHAWMCEAPRRGQRTGCQPPHGAGGREWKNWEGAGCVDWAAFLAKLRAKVAVHRGFTPFIIMEGFLVLEEAAAAAMADHVVWIEVSI